MASLRSLNEFANVFKWRKCALGGSVFSGMYKFRDFSTSSQMEDPPSWTLRHSPLCQGVAVETEIVPRQVLRKKEAWTHVRRRHLSNTD